MGSARQLAESAFDHQTAFSRNIGLITRAEAQLLREKVVAIPGMGGVGGAHLATLTRMGIGGFHIADADRFALANANRQYGAMMSTLDRPKVEVMAGIARDINPEVRLEVFDRFIDATNVDAFLKGCDLVVDSVDAFALEARRLIFTKALAMGIPVVTAAPLGFSASMIVFKPGAMGFDEYFHYREGRGFRDNFVDFLLGVAPRPHFLRYMSTAEVDANEQRGPSSALAVSLCAGFAGAEALKLLLNRGRVRAAPHFHYFDPYLMKFKVGYLPWGGSNPLQRLIFRLVRRRLRIPGA